MLEPTVFDFNVPWVSPETQGTPLTARLGDSDCVVSKGEKMAITVSPWPEHAWLGASREDINQGGWKTKGVFFGGPHNLSNGGGLLVGNWTDRTDDFSPKSIRMTLDRASKNAPLEVYYDYLIEDEWYPLGKAFAVSDSFQASNTEEASSDWFPVLRYDTSTFQENQDIPELNVTCFKDLSIPVDAGRRLPPAKSFYVGNWQMSELYTGSSLEAFPLNDDLKDTRFSLAANGMMHVKVGNSMRGRISGLEECDKAQASGSCKIQIGVISSTLMLIHGERGDLERVLQSELSGINQLDWESDSMVLSGPTMKVVLKADSDDTEYKTFSDAWKRPE